MKKAIIIGCQIYNDPDIAGLQFADSDARAFFRVISENCGFADDEISLLTSNSQDPRFLASRSNIIREISQGMRVSRRVDRVDTLFFFFSGHGFRSSYDNKDYLVTIDSTSSALEETSVSFEAIVKFLFSWNGKVVVLFLDACRATVAGGKSITVENWQSINVSALCPNGTATFCSCSPGHKSYESAKLGHGLFTHTLSEALSDKGKCKTIYEIDSYLIRELPKVCKNVGKPVQFPYTRIEPITIQNQIIVSNQKSLEWQSHAIVGTEIRPHTSKSINNQFPSKAMCAIDFGTSYSTIAINCEDLSVKMIPSHHGKYLIPSVVSFFSNLDYVVGWEALENVKINPERTILNVKRYLGSTRVFNIEGRTLTPELITSLILKSLIRNAEDYLSSEVNEIVVSVPANFSIKQANALAKACEMTDTKLLRLIGEPCASSLLLHDKTHNLGYDEYKPFIAIDLGGGTLDVSVMEHDSEGVFQTLAAAGDNSLGGLDYDEEISKILISEINAQISDPNFSLSIVDIAKIGLEAERIKIALGTENNALAIINNVEIGQYGFKDFKIQISKEVFRKITENLNLRARQCILRALEISGKKPKDIAFVLLAGQGSKIFPVKEIIENVFYEKIIEQKFQETAVIQGLSRYTGVFLGYEKDLLLLDTNYTGIGIYCSEGESDKEEAYIMVSGTSSENKTIYEILPRSTVCPIYQTVVVKPKNPKNGRIILTLIELSTIDDGNIVLGNLDIEVESENGKDLGHGIKIRVDCDVNRTIVVWIGNPYKNEIRGYQINNYFTKPVNPVPSSKFMGLTTDGEIYPIEKLPSFE